MSSLLGLRGMDLVGERVSLASFRIFQSVLGPSTSASRGPFVDPWSGSVVPGNANESGVWWEKRRDSFKYKKIWNTFKNRSWNINLEPDIYTFSCGGHTTPYEVPVIWVSGAWSCRSHLGCTLCRKTVHEGLKPTGHAFGCSVPRGKVGSHTCRGACQPTKQERLMFISLHAKLVLSLAEQTTTPGPMENHWGAHKGEEHKFPPTVQGQSLSLHLKENVINSCSWLSVPCSRTHLQAGCRQQWSVI